MIALMTPPASARPAVLARLRAGLSDPESLRQWRLVANDGIIATAGILEGFAGAGASHRSLLIAATFSTIAGMLAAGGAEWAEAAGERDSQVTAVEDAVDALARSLNNVPGDASMQETIDALESERQAVNDALAELDSGLDCPA